MTAPLPARVITENSYKRFIGCVESRGWNASTHLAEVDFGEGNEEAVVKVLTEDATWPQTGNEAIGYVLAKVGEIPAPAKAAILVADAEALRARMGTAYPAHAPEEGDVLAWCASLLPHLKTATWADAEQDAVLLSVLCSEAGAQIAAFDTWLCNADRNAGNLLRLPGGKWAVIDHELICNGVLGDWRKGTIDHLPATSTLHSKAQQFHSAGRLTAKQLADLEARMLLAAEQHGAVATEAKPRLGYLLEQIYPDSTPENVLTFVTNRAAPPWMRDMLSRLL